MDERKFWMLVRQALLQIVDAVEIRYKIQPRTTELRKFVKAWFKEGKGN